MNMLEQMYQLSNKGNDYFRNYCQYVSKLLAEIDLKAIETVVEIFLKARENDKTIYFAGNGGSAATSSHFAQDIGEIGRKIQGKAFRSQSINDNVSLLTAISNDYGYDNIFSMQIEYNFNPGDILVVISASGNSPNVIKAVELAKKKGGTTVGLIGFSGGRLAEICDCVVHIRSKTGEYGPVEDLHLILDHMITSYLTMMLKKKGKE